MDAIFKSLGIDWTLWVQVGIFIIAFLSLSSLLFKPYMAAYEERKRRTSGNLESATEIEKDTEALQADYEKQAKELNAELKAIFDRARAEGQSTSSQVVDQARAEADRELGSARTLVEKQLGDARTRLKQDVTDLSQVITNKLLNRVGS